MIHDSSKSSCLIFATVTKFCHTMPSRDGFSSILWIICKKLFKENDQVIVFNFEIPYKHSLEAKDEGNGSWKQNCKRGTKSHLMIHTTTSQTQLIFFNNWMKSTININILLKVIMIPSQLCKFGCFGVCREAILILFLNSVFQPDKMDDQNLAIFTQKKIFKNRAKTQTSLTLLMLLIQCMKQAYTCTLCL